ncbi:unnamed protein product, partial [Aphanomyces euteiches]
MHRDLAAHKDKIRSQQRAQKNRGAVPQQFSIGDFVLVLKKSTSVPKTLYMWEGPWVITRTISNWTYEVQNFETKALHEAHACRLKPYRNGSLELSQELLDSIKFCSVGNEVKKIVDARYNLVTKMYECQVVWLGMEDDTTWEPARHLYEDVFTLFKEFVLMKSSSTGEGHPEFALYKAMQIEFPLDGNAPTQHGKLKKSRKKGPSVRAIFA